MDTRDAVIETGRVYRDKIGSAVALNIRGDVYRELAEIFILREVDFAVKWEIGKDCR